MALTPVYVATNRNNTMDGLLVFFLLLAAWAFPTDGVRQIALGFTRRIYRGSRLQYQDDASLPAAACVLCVVFLWRQRSLAAQAPRSRACHAGARVRVAFMGSGSRSDAQSTSLYWFDSNNTVLDLMFGHNKLCAPRKYGQYRHWASGWKCASIFVVQADSALDQFPSPRQNLRNEHPQQALDACADQTQGSACSFTQPNGNTINGSCITLPTWIN